jgi:hypothetical protein
MYFKAVNKAIGQCRFKKRNVCMLNRSYDPFPTTVECANCKVNNNDRVKSVKDVITLTINGVPTLKKYFGSNKEVDQRRALDKVKTAMVQKDLEMFKNALNHLGSLPNIVVLPTDDSISAGLARCELVRYEGKSFLDSSSDCYFNVTGKRFSKGANIENILSVAKAVTYGKKVSKDRQAKRLEVCKTCDMFRDDGVTQSCGVCGCKLDGSSKLVDLTLYEETVRYGCKHPKGSRWKENNV